jgi:hypothetical protein
VTAEQLILSSARAAVATVGHDHFFQEAVATVNKLGREFVDLLRDDDQAGFCLPAQVEVEDAWVDDALVLVIRRATMLVWKGAGRKSKRHLVLDVTRGDQLVEVERIRRTWRLPGRIHLRFDAVPGADITLLDVGGMDGTIDLMRGYLDNDVLLDF